MVPVYILTIMGMSRMLIYDRSHMLLCFFWYAYELVGFSLPLTYMTIVNMVDFGSTPGGIFSFFTSIFVCISIINEVVLFFRLHEMSRELNVKRFGDKLLQSFINPDE